jgi:hypothetical protein
VGTGGGPTARVDLGGSAPVNFEPMVPAIRHWTGRTVLVVIYSDEDQSTLERYTSSRLTAEGCNVAMVARVTTDGRIHAGGNTFLTTGTIPPQFAARRVSESRAALLDEAAKVTDAAQAIDLASQAWFNGDGALAWVFLDRYAAIVGTHDDTYRALEQRLVDAVDPRNEV